jgi:hypothetical protein
MEVEPAYEVGQFAWRFFQIDKDKILQQMSSFLTWIVCTKGFFHKRRKQCVFSGCRPSRKTAELISFLCRTKVFIPIEACATFWIGSKTTKPLVASSLVVPTVRQLSIRAVEKIPSKTLKNKIIGNFKCFCLCALTPSTVYVQYLYTVYIYIYIMPKIAKI